MALVNSELAKNLNHKPAGQSSEKQKKKDNKKYNKKPGNKLPAVLSKVCPVAQQSDKHHAALFFISVDCASTLQSIYLPYIRNGGLFISTRASYALGDQVFVLISLLEEKRKIPLCGTVVWITPIHSLENKCPGIGVRFMDGENRVRAQLESCLRDVKNESGTMVYAAM